MGCHFFSQAAFNFGQYLSELVPLSQLKKPDMGKYLVEFGDEMEKLLSESLVVHGSVYELSIYTFTCDAPAKALLKEIVQHTG